METKSGVYMIRNKVTGEIYIGSTRDLKARRNEHFYRLRNGTHGNPLLQSAWEKYGEKSFEFVIVEHVHKLVIHEREQFYMDKFKNEGKFLYNRTSSAFDNTGLVMSKGSVIIAVEKRKKTREKWTPERHHKFVEKCREPWTSERKEKQSGAVKDYWKKTRGDFVYRFISPDGKKIETKNLHEFCELNGLDTSAMHKVHKGVYGRNSHKGFSKA